MTNEQIITVLNNLMSSGVLTFKQREAISWAIAKLTK